jgi:sortase (surface protein transpeptidase)
MPDSEGADDVAIYDFSAWPGLGGVPGKGNTILGGKVDHSEACRGGTVPPPCRAVFWSLEILGPSDTVDLFWEGQVYRYTVVQSCVMEAAAPGLERMFAATAAESLTLITATGEFDQASGYSQRLFVRAAKAGGSIPSGCPVGMPHSAGTRSGAFQSGDTQTAVAFPSSVGPEDRLRISRIGVDAQLIISKVINGSMADPPEDRVAIYDFSAPPPDRGGPSFFGGAPGGGNTVVYARHSSRQSGPLLFHRLSSLTPGDEADILLGGNRFSYRIVILCTVPSGSFDQVVRRTSNEVLTLITDSDTGPDFRLVAIAERRPGSLPVQCPAGSPAGAANPTGVQVQPAAPALATEAPSLSLVYESRLPPGSLEGALASSLVYRFRIAGAGSGLRDSTYTVSAAGQPDRELRASINNDVIDLPVPTNLPPGPYTLTVRLSDGRTVSVSFEHTRDPAPPVPRSDAAAPAGQPVALQATQALAMPISTGRS